MAITTRKIEDATGRRSREVKFVVLADGVEVGVIWKGKDTRTCKDSWKAQHGVGAGGRFIGTTFDRAVAVEAAAAGSAPRGFVKGSYQMA